MIGNHFRVNVTFMRLIVLSGFLGSGKTTLLLRLARALRAGGARVAIVVNEIGDIGIDNTLLRHMGGAVWELVGGCICCTLGASLVSTLQEIQDRFAADHILLEPSGASQPELIAQTLAAGGSGFSSDWHWLAVVDPLRLTELVAVISPLLEAQLDRADAVVVTKADVASSEQLALARRWVASLRPDVPCLALGNRGAADAGERTAEAELLACL